VFNAETLIIGFSAGALGIAVTALLCIPANAIVYSLTEIPRVAILPAIGAAALVLISMLLTFVAGLLPSRIAARKDPVAALRTE
jgi:putative ABC transport system permease protein